MYTKIVKKEDRNYCWGNKVAYVSKIRITNNSHLTSYPNPASKEIAAGIECELQRSTRHLFRGFHKEKQRKGSKKDERGNNSSIHPQL